MEPPPPRPPRDAGAAASSSKPAPAAAPPLAAGAAAAPAGPFAPACKRVTSRAALSQWEASPAHADLLGFVRALAEAVRGVTLTAEVPTSPAVTAIVDVLATLEVRVVSARVCACVCACASARLR
jgi:hypothetical protein